jgi:glycosyltransferase involved in cell wall biosynthesis
LTTEGLSVSVVIAVRDSERTIQRALRGALAQTTPPDEVIVVDDGSVDETKQRALEVANDRTFVIDGEHRGASAARNRAIARASGAWIAFLDGDDYWKPEFLELARGRIGAVPDAVACFGAATPIDDAGRVIGHHDMRELVTLEELVCGRIVPTTSATLVRRDVAIGCGGFFEDIRHAAEDLDLWWRIAAVGSCVGFPQAAAVYVVHDERDRARSVDVLAEMEHDRELAIDRLAASGAPAALVRRGRAIMRARTARYWLRAGRPGAARAAARSSLRARPTLEGFVTLAMASVPRALREAIVLLRRRHRAGGLLGGR